LKPCPHVTPRALLQEAAYFEVDVAKVVQADGGAELVVEF
jgi:hypothetical protein